MQRRSTNTKQTPDGKSQHKPANVHLTGRESGTNRHKLAASPAQTLHHWRVFLETKTTIFSPWSATSYICERKKKKKNMEKKHIFILLYRRDTRNQDTTGALFTRKQDVGNRVAVFSSSMQTSSSWGDDWAENRIFFNIKRCFVLFTLHSTRLGSTESIWRNLYNRHQF